MFARLLVASSMLQEGLCVSSAWERVGPRNIFDDTSNRGESGTLADAASPAGNPNVIYTGGSNNGASSGLLKSIDMGATWMQASQGLYDTGVHGVFVHPDDPQGNHVYCGTASGIWESTDGAASWKHVTETAAFGLALSFRNCTINGEPHICSGTSSGIANIPAKGGKWSVIKSPAGSWSTPLSVAVDGPTTVVAGCLSGVVWLGTIKNETDCDWQELAEMKCSVVAIDPNNKDHFIFSNLHPPNKDQQGPTSTWQVWESTDGGKTLHGTGHIPGSFYVAIDRQGWFYTGAEAGAFRSLDGGKSWHPYVVNMVSRANYTDNRIPHDYQRISLDFAGEGVAFPSDQGLFIKPAGNDSSLINANGNMSNNIAIKLAISEGEGVGKNYLVMTVWDWNVIASWNSGKNWPATPGSYWDSNKSDGAPSAIGEGGSAYGMGRSNHVVILHYQNIYYSSQGGKNMSRIIIPNKPNTHSSELVYTRLAGSLIEPAGPVYTVMLMSMPPSDGQTHTMERQVVEDSDDDKGSLRYMSYGEQRDECGKDHNGQVDPYCVSGLLSTSGGPQAKYVLKSMNFGQNWTWTKFPAFLQDVSVMAVDPTNAATLYAISSNCLSTSTDQGDTWSACIKASGLEGSFTSLTIKDSKTMIMMRNHDVPLRTQDGGKSWKALQSCAKVSSYTNLGTYSWTHKTLVLHGKDSGAPRRGEYASFVWKSTDDGDTWTDETADLVTMAPNAGVWFGEDFYLTTSGEGILVKRAFEAGEDRILV